MKRSQFKRKSLICLLVALPTVESLHGQQPQPIRREFQVNQYTSDSQVSPSLAIDGDGNFIVVWSSNASAGTDSSGASIQARRFTADGMPIGDDFQVNGYTTNSQADGEVAVDADGNFVVVWKSTGSYGADNSLASVQARRFRADGTPSGGQFQVNNYPTSHQHEASIALSADGSFVVVWHSDGSYGSDTSGFSIQGRRFGADGAPIDSEFQVNSYTTGFQGLPDVELNEDGTFLVVWSSSGSSGSDTESCSIQARRFTANGIPIGDDFQVNAHATGRQTWSKVSSNRAGDFVVVWNSWNSYPSDSCWGSFETDHSGESVQARQFDSNGTPFGDQFQVNSYWTGAQSIPVVATDSTGNFIVVWESAGSYGTDTSNHSIQAQGYAADGTAFGGEFQVNSYTTSFQSRPAVEFGPGGDFLVVWDSLGSSGSDTSSRGVQGQRYSILPALRWPLRGGPEQRVVTLGFGDDWVGSCGGLVKKHTGTDFTASVGERVSAVASGTVELVLTDDTWHQTVVIEHTEGDLPFTTVSWPVDSQVAEGQTVFRGQTIATLADLGPETHLHLGLRVREYSPMSVRRALPQTACEGDPPFPESFIDVELLHFTVFEDGFESGDCSNWDSAEPPQSCTP